MIGVDDVAELRSLLRRRDPVARSLALATLGEWSGRDLGPLGGRAVLEAASGSYPTVEGDTSHPAEQLARMLWQHPRVVPAADVTRAYLVAGERVRRSFLHHLALRRDLDGLDAVEFLLGPAGPTALVPTATTPLLDPLVDLVTDRAAAHEAGGPSAVAQRVARLLTRLLDDVGWTWHAAELIVRIDQLGMLDPTTREYVVEAATRVVHHLVDLCDRAASSPGKSGDSVRSDRERLGVVARLLDQMHGVDRTTALLRMLSSADPRAAALGAARLASMGEPVAPERMGLIARDPLARADLYDGLAPSGRLDLLPAEVGPIDVHEGMLTRWLADVTELGRAPDEMEFLERRVVRRDGPVDDTGVAGAYAEPVYLFRFRMHAPHWSTARGWMVGASGAFTYSCYAAQDECALDDHVAEMRTTLADWPDRRADGAA